MKKILFLLLMAAMCSATAFGAEKTSCAKTRKNCPMNDGKACNCGKKCGC